MESIEESCCVVTVSHSALDQRATCCSGIVLNYQTGMVICNGFLFSGFIDDKTPVPAKSRFLLSDSFPTKPDIKICLPAQRDLKPNQCGNKARLNFKSNPASQHKAKLLMLVNCLEFNTAFNRIFQESDSWNFQGGEEEEGIIKDNKFISWFAVLQTGFEDSYQNSLSIPCTLSSSLCKGSTVVACGSPFGSLCQDLFINTLSMGIISNLAGEDNAVIMTDARCLPGTEGGGLFLTEGHRVRLVGVIVSSLCWKGTEWIGLTLACSIQLIVRNIRNIMCCIDIQSPLKELGCLLEGAAGGLQLLDTVANSELKKYPTVCLIDSGMFWGSGVMVAPRLALTCRHVVHGKSTVTLRFHLGDRFHVVLGDVLFSTMASSSYDFAVIQLRDSAPEIVVAELAKSFQLGEEVVVVGYGGMGQSCGPSLTCGILSKTISCSRQPVMLQTTCAVQAGASGGAVVQKHSGDLLGIVSSNTRDCAANTTYPHLNFSIPVTVFQLLLQRFHQTGDVEVFRDLDTTDAGVRRVWRLQAAQSKL